MEDEDFLAAVEADNKGVPVEEPEAPEPTEPTPEPEPTAEPETPAEPEVLELTEPAPGTTAPPPGFVPIGAMLDTRDRAKAAEERARQLEERLQQFQQKPIEQPDPYEDPEGFAQFQKVQQSEQLRQLNLRYSERLAKVEHGAEVVDAAMKWAFEKCQSDPHFNAKALASDDPAGLAVSEYKREEIASKVSPDEFAQFQAWKAAQSQLTTQPGQAPTPTQTSAIPAPSLASAPSAGTILTEPIQSEEEVFNEVFPKR